MVRVKYSKREGGGLISAPFVSQGERGLIWLRVEIIPLITNKTREFQYAISKLTKDTWETPEIKGKSKDLTQAKTKAKNEIKNLGVFFYDEVRRKKVK